MKGGFPRLKYVYFKKIEDISVLVIVTCTLHYFILQLDNDYEQFNEQPDVEVNDYQNILPDQQVAEDKRGQLMAVYSKKEPNSVINYKSRT